jgi:hypothetical protein
MQSLIHCLSVLNFIHVTFCSSNIYSYQGAVFGWMLLLITESFQNCIFHSCTLKFIIISLDVCVSLLVCEVHSTICKATHIVRGRTEPKPEPKVGIYINSAQFVGSLTPHFAWQLSESIFSQMESYLSIT